MGKMGAASGRAQFFKRFPRIVLSNLGISRPFFDNKIP
jgi:hypothetical protein